MNIPDIVDPTKDYYAVLGVSPDLPADQIKTEYKRQALKHHPDRGGDPAKMQEVNEAWDVIRDPEARVYYDRIRREYLTRQSWSYQKKKKPRGRKRGFFDDLRNKSLKDFIIDSLAIFQEKLFVELPRQVLDDFPTAVQFVYDVWHEVKAQEQAAPHPTKITFGGFEVTREQLIRMDNLLE